MKSLKKNYIYNLVYQVVAIIAPLITAPYISRVLGPENIGKYSYTQSIIAYVIMLSTIGTTTYAQREIAFRQGDKEKQTKVFTAILFIRSSLSLIGCLVIFLIAFYYKEYAILFAIQAIEIFANVICIDWFYAGNENFKATMTRNLAIRVINVVCIFLFVKNRDDLYKYVLIITLSTLFGNATLWVTLSKYISKIEFKGLEIVGHFRGSLSVFSAQVAASVYSMLDKIMIGLITHSEFENGYYEQAQKIEKIALIFVTALGTVIMPKISKAYADNNEEEVKKSINKSFNYMWFISIPMCFGMISTASVFIPWFFGEEYNKSIVLIQILALLLIAIGINNITGLQFLMSTNKEKLLTESVLVGAVINVVFNLVLISRFQSIGAAIASVIAEFSVAITQLLFIRRIIDVKHFFAMSKNYFISGLLMLAAVLIMKHTYFYRSDIVSIICLVFIGVVSYLIGLLLQRDTIIISIIERVRVKISK